MNLLQFRQLIKEEIQNVLTEYVEMRSFYRPTKNKFVLPAFDRRDNIFLKNLGPKLDVYVKQGKLPSYTLDIKNGKCMLVFSGKNLEKEYPEAIKILKKLHIWDRPWGGIKKVSHTTEGKQIETLYSKIYKGGDTSLNRFDKYVSNAKLDSVYDKWIKDPSELNSREEKNLLQAMQDFLDI